MDVRNGDPQCQLFDPCYFGRRRLTIRRSHEQLMKRSEAQDAHIQSLLGQLDGLKRLTEIRKLVAKANDEAAALRATPNGVPMDGQHSYACQ